MLLGKLKLFIYSPFYWIKKEILLYKYIYIYILFKKNYNLLCFKNRLVGNWMSWVGFDRMDINYLVKWVKNGPMGVKHLAHLWSV